MELNRRLTTERWIEVALVEAMRCPKALRAMGIMMWVLVRMLASHRRGVVINFRAKHEATS